MPARKDDPVWHEVHQLLDALDEYMARGWRVEMHALPAAYPVLRVRVSLGDYSDEGKVYAHVQWMTVAEYWRSAYRVALYLIRKSGRTSYCAS